MYFLQLRYRRELPSVVSFGRSIKTAEASIGDRKKKREAEKNVSKDSINRLEEREEGFRMN